METLQEAQFKKKFKKISGIFYSEYQKDHLYFIKICNNHPKEYKAHLEPASREIEQYFKQCEEFGFQSFEEYIDMVMEDPVTEQKLYNSMNSIYRIINHKDVPQTPRLDKKMTFEESKDSYTPTGDEDMEDEQKMQKIKSKSPLEKLVNTAYSKKTLNQETPGNQAIQRVSQQQQNMKPQDQKKTNSILGLGYSRSAGQGEKIAENVKTALGKAQNIKEMQQLSQNPQETKLIRQNSRPNQDIFSRIEQQPEYRQRIDSKSVQQLPIISDSYELQQCKKKLEEQEQLLIRQQKLLEMSSVSEFNKLFGLHAAKVYFLFQDKKGILDIGNENINQLPYYDVPLGQIDLTSLQYKFIQVSTKGKQWICACGQLHEDLMKAYYEVMKSKDQCIIEGQTKIYRKLFEFQIKLLYFSDEIIQGEISEMRKVNNFKDFCEMKIKRKFRGPQIEYSFKPVWIDSNGKEIYDINLMNGLDLITSKMKQTQQNEVCWIKLDNINYFLACELEGSPFLLNPNKQEEKRFFEKKNTIKEVWDFVQTFKPPQDIGYDQRSIYKVVDLDPESIEYQYVAYKFGKTRNGRNEMTLNIKETLKMLKSEGLPIEATQIVKIEKIYNSVIYQRFEQELKIQLSKYKNKTAIDIMRHLFHGTRNSNPKSIYSTEDGLDLRFSNDGMNGFGVYFADNAQYSHDYCHNTGYHKQMLVCLVLIGDSANFGGGRGVRIPPLKPNQNGERYDSINNGPGGHYIIYDNLKSYPGYVITYN